MTAYIGFNNELVDAASVVATDSAVDFPVENCFDWLTSDWWKPASSGIKYITADAGLYKTLTADYLGIAAHSLWSEGTRIGLQSSADGVTWSDILASYWNDSGVDTTSFKKFNSTVARFIRAVLTPKMNLLTYSEEFDNAAWTKTNCSVTQNAAASPEYTLTADKLIESTATAEHMVTRNVTGLADNTVVVLSVRAKADTRPAIRLRLVSKDAVNNSATYNLNTNAVILTGGANLLAHGIIDLGNGWKRVYIVVDVKSGATTPAASYAISNGTTTIGYTGDGASGIFVHGGQLDQCSALGVYVPTTSAAITGTCGSIGMLSIGAALTLSEGMPVGFVRPTFARDTDFKSNVTQGGAFVGRSVRRYGYEFTLSQDDLSEAWMDESWPGLIAHVEQKPFFFSWDYERYPNDAVYCWVDKSIKPPKYTTSMEISFDLKLRGI